MFGPITLETFKAWDVFKNSTVREERERAIAELSKPYNAHDHVKHSLGQYQVRVQDGEYIVIHHNGSIEVEVITFPVTLDGLHTAVFNATSRAMRAIDATL